MKAGTILYTLTVEPGFGGDPDQTARDAVLRRLAGFIDPKVRVSTVPGPYCRKVVITVLDSSPQGVATLEAKLRSWLNGLGASSGAKPCRLNNFYPGLKSPYSG